ncbi:MAG: IS110 family transposase [Candidatus Eisenbacteria bacterium]|uniref:IS110 family transposase n=1 Tax=Eiseniibacteriota bacterium TaxID=2212470 RepID=A0A933SDB2_UNCEI|nr:IS110 family transposase [Candidatus Eisenbacteria bacterium]
MGRYVGLDVHSKHSVYAIQDDSGRLVGEGSVPTTTEGLQLLRARYELPDATRVALESGTMAFFVARRLTRLGFAPLVVDAHEVRQKALRPNQKSDRRDALELCEGLRRDVYRTTVHVPPEAIERLRETLGRRRHFVRLKTMEVNAVKRLLRATGLPVSTRCLSTPTAWERLLKALEVEPGLQAFCASHRAVWLCAHEQVATLDASLRAQGHAFEAELARLQTVPGVGPIVATTMLAALSDVSRFPSAKHVASYAGLVASTYDSGESVRHGHITRRGSSELRAMLCEAAHHAGRPSSPFHPYFTSLCARRGHKMAVVAVAHRLCRIMFTMLRKGEDFDINKLGIERGRFEHKIVRHYRRKVAVATKASR